MIPRLGTTEHFLEKFSYSKEVHKVRDTFKKILIANNGIAALKFIRSIRQWSYDRFGYDRAVKFVVMVTPEDIDARAEFTQLADELIRVQSGPSQINYGNVDLILDIAQELGVQAVWAGWGHASENPRLPELLEKSRILFLGPNHKAMKLLGDKIYSTLIAQSLGIPVLPWSGDNIQLERNININNFDIKSEVYESCYIKNERELHSWANKIGYPVMIKASNGGGGKGIRKIENDENCERMLNQIFLEVPDCHVFAVKHLSSARHIEIQIIGDLFNNVISLFSRDCTIQRRHQKIIEEAPAIICPPNILSQMEAHAIALASSVNYAGVGTVEFLYDVANNKFYFLELNPRLQVEHPCTEIIADINLPACQLEVSIGRFLKEIKDLNKFASTNSTEYQNNGLVNPFPKGHVISVRILAESAEDGFKPSSGSIKQLNFRNNRNLWGYFSIHSGGKLHQYADSQFGHVFSSGQNREEARKGMVLALKELSVHGEIRTIIEYLVGLLEHPSFLKNTYTTDWLNTLSLSKMSDQPCIVTIICCACACIANNRLQAIYSKYKQCLERGKILKPEILSEPIQIEFLYDSRQFNMLAVRASEHGFYIITKSSYKYVEIYPIGNEGSLILLESKSYTCFLNEEVSHFSIEIGSSYYLLRKRTDPGIIRSPSSAKLVSLFVEDGDYIQKGTEFAEIEVMKMVMPLTAPESGKIKILKHVGSILESGSIIAKLDLTSPSSQNSIILAEDILLRNSVLFDYEDNQTITATSSLNDSLERELRSNYKRSYQRLRNIMQGYSLPEPHFSNSLKNDFDCFIHFLSQPNFVSFSLSNVLFEIRPFLPDHIYNIINKHVIQFSVNSTSIFNEFPTIDILTILNTHAQLLLNKREREKFFYDLSPLIELINKLKIGSNYYKLNILTEFIDLYLNVETNFDEETFENALLNHMEKLDTSTPDYLDTILSLIISRSKVNYKNILLLKIIDSCSIYTKYSHECCEHIKQKLTSLSNLICASHIKVALRAKQILIQLVKPTFELRYNQLESIFLSIVCDSKQKSLKILQKVVHYDGIIIDVLPAFFLSSNSLIQQTSMEIYIRRTYMLYDLLRLNHELISQIPIVTFMLSRKFPKEFTIPTSSLSTIIPSKITKIRYSIMACMSSFEELSEYFVSILSRLELAFNSAIQDIYYNTENVNNISESSSIVHICIYSVNFTKFDQNILSHQCYDIVVSNIFRLKDLKVSRITFLICSSMDDMPYIFTFRSRNNFREDLLHRNIEPATGFLLEIHKMNNFDIVSIPSENPNIHIFHGRTKISQSQNIVGKNYPLVIDDVRFFIHTIIRNPELISVEASFDYLVKASDLRLLEALDQLELAYSKVTHKPTSNQIFFNFTPCIVIDPKKTIECIKMIVYRYSKRLQKLNVIKAEMKMVVLFEPDGDPVPLRLIVSGVSGYSLSIDLYKEIYDHSINKIIYHPLIVSDTEELSGLPISTPYSCLNLAVSKRLLAHHLHSPYVYDIPLLFSLIIKGRSYMIPKEKSISPFEIIRSKNICQFREMILGEDGNLVFIDRESGLNSVGIVCWLAQLVDSSIPLDLNIVVIANDITIHNGSFSITEANIYQSACNYAKTNNLPLVYICCTSGARIGLAEEVLECFKVQWIDNNNIEKGVSYLYLNESDYKRLNKLNSIMCEPIIVEDTTHYKITSIIGQTDGIGVENLTGSGMIAGQMSSCYESIFTISYVIGKAVGIGAYLVRLGRRVIQGKTASILLTGAEALNKVLGSSIYSSHNQIGGIEIMNRNGVSQLVAKDDFHGISLILKWLSYYNSVINTKLIKPCQYFHIDADAREGDPRRLIYGFNGKDNEFIHGFFDKDSVFEINNEWAKTVITGRAKLNGIPCAYLMNDDKFIKSVTPADPADPKDIAREYYSVGQVLTPDSSYKFAQCIDDANREHLPLFIFSNFRGFSAGLRDMYNQILKFGAMIVDSLRNYKQPVFVYIMPYGELRGGSWAVLDMQINPRCIEIYSSETAKANVLEPSGVVSVKRRSAAVFKAIERLNSEYETNLGIIKQDFCNNKPVIDDVMENFAKLHDTPDRMIKKGVIKGIVNWLDSRHFFCYRLKRRLLEFQFYDIINRLDSKIDVIKLTESLFKAFYSQNSFDDDDLFIEWMEQLLQHDCVNVIEQTIKDSMHSDQDSQQSLSQHISSKIPDTLHISSKSSLDDILISNLLDWINMCNINKY